MRTSLADAKDGRADCDKRRLRDVRRRMQFRLKLTVRSFAVLRTAQDDNAASGRLAKTKMGTAVPCPYLVDDVAWRYAETDRNVCATLR